MPNSSAPKKNKDDWLHSGYRPSSFVSIPASFGFGIITHSTNAVKNLAAAQAFPRDNVDEGSSQERPAKKAKQPAKPYGDAASTLSSRPQAQDPEEIFCE
eukprot:jgi/Tetstr1/430760/TSEL_020545.t1